MTAPHIHLRAAPREARTCRRRLRPAARPQRRHIHQRTPRMLRTGIPHRHRHHLEHSRCLKPFKKLSDIILRLVIALLLILKNVSGDGAQATATTGGSAKLDTMQRRHESAAGGPSSISPLDYQMRGAQVQPRRQYSFLQPPSAASTACGGNDPTASLKLERTQSSPTAHHAGAATTNARGESRRPAGAGPAELAGFDCYNGKVLTGITVKGASDRAKTAATASKGGGTDPFGRVQTY